MRPVPTSPPPLLGRQWVISPAQAADCRRCVLQADSLPRELRDAKISHRDFMATQQLVRKFHRVHVPLSFWQNTGHSCDVQATQRLVRHACKVSIPDVRRPPARHLAQSRNATTSLTK